MIASLLALGLLAGSATAHTVKKKTTVVIGGYIYDETNTVTFIGHVECVKVCRKRRAITLKQTDLGIVAGRATTDSRGEWRISFKGPDVPPGHFKAKAARSVSKKEGHRHVIKRIVCKQGVGTYAVMSGRGF